MHFVYSLGMCLLAINNYNHMKICMVCVQIKTIEDEQAYSMTLRTLLDNHRDVVSLLAEGFSECRKYIVVRKHDFQTVSIGSKI